MRIGMGEFSRHASRYLAEVRAGRTVEITEHGTVVARVVPEPQGRREPVRPRVRTGGYRSGEPTTEDGLQAQLARGFGR